MLCPLYSHDFLRRNTRSIVISRRETLRYSRFVSLSEAPSHPPEKARLRHRENDDRGRSIGLLTHSTRKQKLFSIGRRSSTDVFSHLELLPPANALTMLPDHVHARARLCSRSSHKITANRPPDRYVSNDTTLRVVSPLILCENVRFPASFP